MINGLAQRLRAATKELHAVAERAGIMPDLLRGQLTRQCYCELLRNLFEIYRALELALTARAGDPALAPVVFPRLFRTATLAADLDILWPGSWREQLPLQSATHLYVARIEELSESAPALLAAHAYVRYLGDLSGGQILRRIVARMLGTRQGEGTSFYEFGSDLEVAQSARVLRAGLAALPVDESREAAIVAEALDGFRMHERLFVELAQSRDRALLSACPATD